MEYFFGHGNYEMGFVEILGKHFSTADAFAAVRSGRINNSAAIIALQWLELNLREVTEQFGVVVDK